MNVAHVICCNDRVEHVFIGSEANAKFLMAELKRKEYNAKYANQMGWQNYIHHFYWHIHTAPVTREEDL